MGDARLTFELGERPAVEPRPSRDADARLRAAPGLFADSLDGDRPVDSSLELVSGSDEARAALVRALGG